MAARRRPALFLAVLLAPAACAEPEPPAPDPQSPVAGYVRTGDWGEGNTALLEGVLRLRDGCVVVETEGRRVVPVFPTDLEWREDEGTLSGLGEEIVLDGAVALGGGYTSPAVADHLPEACGEAELFIVHSVGEVVPS